MTPVLFHTVLHEDQVTRSTLIGMEVAGLAVGLAGLAGLFSTCIECFDYVELATTFGTDLGTCLLRLDVARLRLSRWGVCAGLAITNGNGMQIPARVPLSMQEDDYRVAQQLLEHICNAFAVAEKMSARYEVQTTSLAVRPSAVHGQLALPEQEERDGVLLDSSVRRVHTSLTELARGRQKQASLLRKTRWALHDKKRFEKLIDVIHDSVQSLIDLFPAPAVEQMRQLSRVEASGLASGEDVQLLAQVCSADDTILSEALQRECTIRGHFAHDWDISGQARVRIGDRSMGSNARTSHTASKFVVTDSAEVWVGNEIYRKP